MGADQVRDIRVMKPRDAQDIAKRVADDGRSEISEIEAALSRMIGKFERTKFAERDVFTQLLESNLIMAKRVNRVLTENNNLKSVVSAQEIRLAALERAIQV